MTTAAGCSRPRPGASARPSRTSRRTSGCAAAPDSYVRPSVKIELGAKSALDPHVSASVEPFIATEMATTGLRVQGITTIEPTRTFWDKVIILHGLRRWFERRGDLRQEGQRITRHY